MPYDDQHENFSVQWTSASASAPMNAQTSTTASASVAATLQEPTQASASAAAQAPLQTSGHQSAQATAFTATGERRSAQSLDDDAIKRMMKGSTPSFFDRYGSCAVTFVLIAINVAVFLIEAVMAGFSPSIDSYTLFDMGAMFAPAVQSAADLYRFVTPMFLHVDIMHLLFNMAALYSVGVMLEGFLGRWNFLLLYFIGGITGNLVSFMVDTVTGSLVVSAGASTSIFGLFVAAAMLGLLSRGPKGQRAALLQYSRGFLGVIVINIVYTLAMPSVSISGHLGGAIGGLIAMFIIPSRNLRVANVVRVVVAAAWVAGIGFALSAQGVLTLA